jgi:hypothetical protein
MDYETYQTARKRFVVALSKKLSQAGIAPTRKETDEREIDQLWIFQHLRKFQEAGKQEQDLHNLRVPLYFTKFLEQFCPRKPQLYTDSLLAATCHDLGKLELMEIVDKEDFSTEDFKIMKDHVWIGSAMIRPYNEYAADLILLSHFIQSQNHYPLDPKIKLTPDLWGLASGLGIVDCYDRLATTTNNRPNRNILEKLWANLVRQGRLSPSRIKKELERYHGESPTKITDRTEAVVQRGREFIDKMYQEGVFGSDNPVLPEILLS